jgi:outer membrane protein with beta-barrel domain
MKKMILSCLAAAVLATGAKAQMAIGPEGGINISNYTGFSGGQYLNTTIQTGIRIGGVVQDPISHSFYIERGLFYVMNGFKMDVPAGNASARINTAELPLNLLYKFHANRAGDRVFIGIGPYLAFNMTGRYKVTAASVDRKLSFGSDDHDDMKIVDFGAGASIGYQVGNGVFIRAHAQMGFVNLKPYGDENNALYNTNYGVTIGYLFMHDMKPHGHMMHGRRGAGCDRDRDMEGCHHGRENHRDMGCCRHHDCDRCRHHSCCHNSGSCHHEEMNDKHEDHENMEKHDEMMNK